MAITSPAQASCVCGLRESICGGYDRPNPFDMGMGKRCCEACHIGGVRNPNLLTCDECDAPSPSPTPMPRVESSGCAMGATLPGTSFLLAIGLVVGIALQIRARRGSSRSRAK